MYLIAGTLTGFRRLTAVSRATPSIERRSARFAVISRSRTSPSMDSTPTPAMTRSFASSCGVAGGSTYSFSQESGTFISELPQEGEMVFIKAADVRDAVLEHRDPLDAHAE